MATVTKGKTFASGEVVTPLKIHQLVDAATVTGIVNADIDAGAAIAAAKLAATLDLTGKTVTLPVSSVVTASIADSSSTTTGVTNAKIRQSAALSVIGNSTNATAAPADIAAATDGHVMRRSGTAIGFGTITGSSIAAGSTLSYPTLTGVREAIVNTGAVSGTQTLNLQSGNIFQIKPNGSITIAFSNVPSSGTFVGAIIRHEGDGTARTYTWPTTTKWAYGEAPSMTSTNGKFDMVSLFTYDGGTNWFGQILGQNY
jgi:hypothetical protein